jgi:pectin lyase
MLAGILSAALLIPAVSAAWEDLPVPAKAAVSYPVQYFRLGMSDTDNNVNAAGSASLPDKYNGTAAEKWSVNYVSSGVFEIVSAENGMILTANGSGVSLANDTDGANQRWKIEGVQKDYDGYDLYY